MQELQTNGVLSVLKNHPVFRGRGVVDLWAENVSSNRLLFFGCDSWVGFSETELKNYEGIRPAPVTFTSIKNHLPSSLSWQSTKRSKKKKTSTLKPKFSVHSLWGKNKKNPPNLQCCLEGDDSLLRLLRTPKLKRKKKRKRFLAVTKQISPECTPLISNVSLCFLPFFCHRPERERMGKEKRDRQALDGLMSIPSPPRHLSPDPASPVRRRLFSSLPFCPLSLPQKGENN